MFAILVGCVMLYDTVHEPGMLQLQKFAAEHGWQDGELSPLGASSTKKMQGLLASSTAEGHFQSLRSAGPGVAYIKIHRTSPFSAWKEVEYRFDKEK